MRSRRGDDEVPQQAILTVDEVGAAFEVLLTEERDVSRWIPAFKPQTIDGVCESTFRKQPIGRRPRLDGGPEGRHQNASLGALLGIGCGA